MTDQGTDGRTDQQSDSKNCVYVTKIELMGNLLGPTERFPIKGKQENSRGDVFALCFTHSKYILGQELLRGPNGPNGPNGPRASGPSGASRTSGARVSKGEQG